MKGLVGLMLLAFAANLVLARPSLGKTIDGLVPSFPASTAANLDLLVVFGLVATTFSAGGAFYQAYLVKQKGWTREDLRTGFFDSVFGISMLCLMSLMIMHFIIQKFTFS